jgi:hypothetical protein
LPSDPSAFEQALMAYNANKRYLDLRFEQLPMFFQQKIMAKLFGFT